jgi:outer membrane protein OmpA-like peptidoglycan-associated protein
MLKKLSLLLVVLVAFAAGAQQPTQSPLGNLFQAQQVMKTAEAAGAAVTAKSLYEDAQWRLRFAEENWNAGKSSQRDQAKLRAAEAMWAARAALAKAQWLGTTSIIRSLQDDIRRFGGSSNVTVQDESPSLDLNRGTTSKARIDFAQAAVDQARNAGGDKFAAADLEVAERDLKTARKIAGVDKTSESADHLAFISEMMARRAYYLAQGSEVNKNLSPLQMERTRLAQAEAERMAAKERADREAAQQAAADLQRQLTAEQAGREMQATELNQLRQQIEDNRRQLAERMEQDRAARLSTEQRLNEAIQKYESSITTASPAEVEALRRQVEDQQISLRAMQERERINEQAMTSEIDTLRNQLDTTRQQGTTDAAVLAQRESELKQRQEDLDRMHREREEQMSRVTEMQRQHDTAIAEAQRKRQDAEAEAQQLRTQVAQVQQQAQATQAELDRTRRELADREAESRRLKMEQELSRIAKTRTEARGFIVTLPGIFFDTGKTTLKPGAKNTLQKIAAQLKDGESIRMVIEGHTDSVGSTETNRKLSEARAQAVRDYLVGTGISADRVSVTGRGEEQPVATNKTAAGRQQNRRVELVITQGMMSSQ